jgi:hypothetical protein
VVGLPEHDSENSWNPDRSLKRQTEAGIPKECRLKLGWKTINGRRYHYKSERVECRVKTAYYESENRHALKMEEIGTPSTEGVETMLVHKQFIESFGGW